MKNKFRTWLNIITICMCFAALAVGVYAASQASLKVSGQIGFTAHNCKVSVNGYIYGHGATLTNGEYLDDIDGNPVPVPTAQDGSDKVMLSDSPINIEGGVSTEAESTLSFGNRYFTDMQSETGKPDDIYIVISVTNTSEHYKVKATVDETTMIFGKVKASVVGDKSAILDTSGTKATAEFTFKLELTAESDGSYADITTNLQAVILKMMFERYEMIKSDIIQNTADGLYVEGEDTTYYYIEMGVNPYTQEPLRWVPIAKYNESTQTYEQHQKTTPITMTGTYYFVSEYLLKLVSYNFYDDATHASDNTPAVYYDGTEYKNPTINAAEGTLVHANDYSISNVRAYLNSDPNNPAYERYNKNKKYYPDISRTLTGTNSFLSYFQISTDPVYSQITARPLSGAQNGATFSLYSDIGSTTTTTTKTAKDFYSTTKTINGIDITTQATDADKLWCLSYYEISKFFTSQTLRKAYKLPAISLDTGNETFTGEAYGYDLRTPDSIACNAYSIGSSGSPAIGFIFSQNGVRPAFQITIT